MLSTKHITGLFFIGILVMSGIAPMLADTFDVSNTAVSPLVVQFGDSVEELAAIAELKSNFPRARVVDFSVYERIMAFKGPIIYVGHSSDSGIQYYGKIVSWDVLADMIRHSKSNSHYILGCESLKIMELTKSTGKNVFSFTQKVDAILGALVVASLISRSIKIFQKLVTIGGRLIKGEQSPRYLSYFGGSEWDGFYFLVASIFLILFPLTMGALGLSTAFKISALLSGGLATAIQGALYTFAQFIEALFVTKNYVNAFTYFLSFMVLVVIVIDAIINGKSYFIKLAAKPLFVSEQAASLTWPKMMLVSVGLASLVVSIFGMLSDIEDDDAIIFSSE